MCKLLIKYSLKPDPESIQTSSFFLLLNIIEKSSGTKTKIIIPPLLHDINVYRNLSKIDIHIVIPPFSSKTRGKWLVLLHYLWIFQESFEKLFSLYNQNVLSQSSRTKLILIYHTLNHNMKIISLFYAPKVRKKRSEK